jgi:hypothetical protein
LSLEMMVNRHLEKHTQNSTSQEFKDKQLLHPGQLVALLLFSWEQKGPNSMGCLCSGPQDGTEWSDNQHCSQMSFFFFFFFW